MKTLREKVAYISELYEVGDIARDELLAAVDHANTAEHAGAGLDSQVIDHVSQNMYRIACEHGFHERDTAGRIPDDFGRYIANLHGEVSELWEAFRKGQLHDKCDKQGCDLSCAEEELADIMIRTMDTAEQLGISLGRAVIVKAAYNETRPYQHGGKKA